MQVTSFSLVNLLQALLVIAAQIQWFYLTIVNNFISFLISNVFVMNVPNFLEIYVLCSFVNTVYVQI